jgi:hypothetical protein
MIQCCQSGRPTPILLYNGSNEVQNYAVVTFSYCYDHVCLSHMRNSELFSPVVWTQVLCYFWLLRVLSRIFFFIYLFRGV